MGWVESEILSVTRRADRDMRQNIRAVTYHKASRGTLFQDRLRAAIRSVVTPDGSGVRLEFCFTGLQPYGQHIICAAWPKDERPVRYELVSDKELSPLVLRHLPHGGYASYKVVDRESDPVSITAWQSSDEKIGEMRYFFFSQDPHRPHRPYFFTSFDQYFGRADQDDAQVIAHHGKGLLHKAKQFQNHLGVLMERPSVADLVVLEDVLRKFPDTLELTRTRFLERGHV